MSSTAASDRADLSSISSVVDDLLRRVVAVAERYAEGPDDDVANGLFDVERSLANAGRRLDQVSERLSRL